MKLNFNFNFINKIKMELFYKLENDNYSFDCPYCNVKIMVNKREINCTIFRCGIYKSNYLPINPHSSLEECTRLKESNLIYGCGQPFKFNGNELVKCEYI